MHVHSSYLAPRSPDRMRTTYGLQNNKPGIKNHRSWERYIHRTTNAPGDERYGRWKLSTLQNTWRTIREHTHMTFAQNFLDFLRSLSTFDADTVWNSPNLPSYFLVSPPLLPMRMSYVGSLLGVDGVHIKLTRRPSYRDLPPGLTEKQFVNRKGWHSLNLQAVGDCDGLLREVDVRWPGKQISSDDQIYCTCSFTVSFNYSPILC